MQNTAMLLVEGEGDRLFFAEFLKRIPLAVDVQPDTPKNVAHKIYRNGVNTLLTRLNFEIVRLIRGELGKLAVVLDADQSPDFGFQNRRNKVESILANHGFNSGAVPALQREGEVFTHVSGAEVGLWIMPDHFSDGLFENFLLPTIAASGQALLQTAQTTVSGLGGQQLFKPIHQPKAELATWLAWQKEPGISPSYAYSQDLFDKQHPNLIALSTWLTRVFK